MKKNLFLVVFVLFYLQSSAQNSSKSSLDITLGASFPTGNFAGKNLFGEDDGLAKTGAFMELSYRNQFSKVLGFAAALKGSLYGIDASGFSLPSGTGASSQINTTTWKTGTVLGGIYQLIPLSNNQKFSLEFRELAGIQFSSSPEMTINATIPGVGSMSGKQESASSTSFAYALAAGFRYQLNNSLGLKIFTDYNSSSAKFGSINVSSGGTTAQESSNQKITVVNVGVGLNIAF